MRIASTGTEVITVVRGRLYLILTGVLFMFIFIWSNPASGGAYLSKCIKYIHPTRCLLLASVKDVGWQSIFIAILKLNSIDALTRY